MRLGRVGSDQQYRLGKVNVIVGVGHRPVTPGIGYPGDRGGMTDTRLVVDIVGAPHRREFTEQVSLFVTVLGRTQPIDRIRSGFLPNIEQFVTDFVYGLIPGNLFPLTIDQLGRILETTLTVSVFTDGCTLGAMATFVEGVYDDNRIPDVARHLAKLNASYQVSEALNIFAEAVYVGSRQLDFASTVEELGGYTVFNLAASWQRQNWTLQARLNNISEKEYSEFTSFYGSKALFPSAERSLMVSLAYDY